MNYKRFNRHEIFTAEDMDNVRNAINNLFDLGLAYTEYDNMLYGLYDGYYYEGIDEKMYQELDFGVFRDLVKTLKKVDDHIKANGESVTLV